MKFALVKTVISYNVTIGVTKKWPPVLIYKVGILAVGLTLNAGWQVDGKTHSE